jgi:hypothetical protein
MIILKEKHWGSENEKRKKLERLKARLLALGVDLVRWDQIPHDEAKVKIQKKEEMIAI